MKKQLINSKKRFRDFLEASWEEQILWWIKDNEMKTEKDISMEFKDRRFLEDIFNDWSPIQTCRKASQIGFSTLEIIKSFFAARNKGWNIIYTLPTFGDVMQFVSSKVNPIIANNSQLSNWVKEKDTTFLKQIDKRFVYYRGTFSKKTQKEKMQSGVGIMLTSDLNIHDESDRSDQTIIEQYESRLEASQYGGKWYFSNPTVPGTLTQKLWDKSDQKHWFIKCPRCGKLQWLDYYKNVCKEKGIYICQKCKKEITDDTRRNGFWVRKYRDKEISGYWISHMMAPWISASKLIESEKNSTKQYFYNFNLGLPYIGSDVTVDAELILKNVVYGEPNFKVNNVIGVDTGLRMHYTLGNKQGIFKVGVTTDWDEIEFLMKKYEALAVFDGLGDLTKPRKLRDKYRGRVWLTYFKRDKDQPDAVKWDPDKMAVYVDRTKIIQRVIDEFVDSNMKFYVEPEELLDYIDHWKTLYQIEETDTIGVTRKVWETSGENHHIFSTIYFYLGLLKAGRAKVMNWSRPAENLAHDPTAFNIQEMIEKNQFQNSKDWRK